MMGSSKPPWGNSRRFLCCIVPRDGTNSIFLAVAVVLPVVIFLSSVAPLRPLEWVPTLILTLLSLLSLTLAVTVDPGILPRKKEEQLSMSLPTTTTATSIVGSSVPTGEAVLIRGVSVQLKYCTTCCILKPPRASHCTNCDYCVEEFDHHCGVLGSCVAKRTFRFFAYFMHCSTLLCGWVLVMSVYSLSTVPWVDGSWRVIAGVGCCIYSAVCGCCVLPQSGYYVFLACKNSSQKEEGYYNRRGGGEDTAVNIFDEGPVMNCGKRMCGPLGDSKITTP